MPQTKNGIVYYQTNEACKLAGISRATFFRWLKEGTIEDVRHKDRRGWRLFTGEDIENLKKEANKVISTETDDRQLKIKVGNPRKPY
jgi:excisionase family DNA binding protein